MPPPPPPPLPPPLLHRYIAFCNSLASGKGDEVEKHKEGFLKELALYDFQLGERISL